MFFVARNIPDHRLAALIHMDVHHADELGAALRQLPVPSSAFVLEIFVTVSSTNEYPTDDSLCSSQDQ